jgi:opacity protein-like surface antigen
MMRDTAKAEIGWAVTALTALIVGAPATAAAKEGWYARAEVAAPSGGEVDISAEAPFGGDESLDEGLIGAIGVGYANGANWRFDVQLSQRDGDIEAGPLLDPGGSIAATTLLASAYRDFGDGPFVPYVGVGIGIASVTLEAENTAPLVQIAIDDTATTFAYQLSAGFQHALSENLKLDVGYRYFAAPGYEGTGSLDGLGATPPVDLPVDADLSQHSVAIGLQWGF